MALPLQKPRYYQNLLSTGFIGLENDYFSSTQNASATRASAAISNATGQAVNQTWLRVELWRRACD